MGHSKKLNELCLSQLLLLVTARSSLTPFPPCSPEKIAKVVPIYFHKPLSSLSLSAALLKLHYCVLLITLFDVNLPCHFLIPFLGFISLHCKSLPEIAHLGVYVCVHFPPPSERPHLCCFQAILCLDYQLTHWGYLSSFLIHWSPEQIILPPPVIFIMSPFFSRLSTETGRGQGATFKRTTQPEDVTQTDQKQVGPRWQMNGCLLDLELWCTLKSLVTHQQAK